MKKMLILALVLALTMTGAALAEVKSPMEAPAEPLYRNGDYLYALREDGTAEIVIYDREKIVDPFFGVLNPQDELLTVPEELDGHRVAAIGDLAFRQCEMKTVAIPDGVTEIGANPFAGCALLKEIRVSQDHPTLAVIGGVLFSKADKRMICYPQAMEATSYAVPQGIEVIGDWAFSQCGALKRVTIPDSVRAIGDYAFARCGALASPALPEGLTDIGDYAFAWCYMIGEMSIPNSVAEVGENPFAFCASLKDIRVSDGHPALTVTDGALFDRNLSRLICYPEGLEATEYALPQGTRSIGGSAFSASARLEGVIVPEGVEEIGYRAFALCQNLVEVVLPQSVTAIDDEAFYGCERVTLVTPRGSFAADYGEANGVRYIYQDANSWLNG